MKHYLVPCLSCTTWPLARPSLPLTIFLPFHLLRVSLSFSLGLLRISSSFRASIPRDSLLRFVRLFRVSFFCLRFSGSSLLSSISFNLHSSVRFHVDLFLFLTRFLAILSFASSISYRFSFLSPTISRVFLLLSACRSLAILS